MRFVQIRAHCNESLTLILITFYSECKYPIFNKGNFNLSFLSIFGHTFWLVKISFVFFLIFFSFINWNKWFQLEYQLNICKLPHPIHSNCWCCTRQKLHRDAYQHSTNAKLHEFKPNYDCRRWCCAEYVFVFCVWSWFAEAIKIHFCWAHGNWILFGNE